MLGVSIKERADTAFLNPNFKSLLTLTWPLAVVQLSVPLANVVDTFFAGKLGELHLAAMGLGGALFLAATIVPMGIVLAVEPLVAQSYGRRKLEDGRAYMMGGALLAGLLSLPFGVAYLVLTFGAEWLGIDAAMARLVESYSLGRVWAITPALLMLPAKAWLQVHRFTRPILLSAFIANVANALLDWLAVYGALQWGIDGLFWIGVASVGAAGLQCVGMLFPLWGQRLQFRRVRARWREVLDIGWPLGFQLMAEVGIFALVQFMMGLLGARYAAAHQIALAYASLSFSVCLGLGTATSVWVGKAAGYGDLILARAWGRKAMGLGITFMTGMGFVFWVGAPALTGLMSKEEGVVQISGELLKIAALFQIVDGIQAIGSGALRGLSRTRVAFLANFVGHWLIGLPVALGLAYGMNLGAAGLWWGLTAGLSVVAIGLSVAFFWGASSP